MPVPGWERKESVSQYWMAVLHFHLSGSVGPTVTGWRKELMYFPDIYWRCLFARSSFQCWKKSVNKTKSCCVASRTSWSRETQRVGAASGTLGTIPSRWRMSTVENERVGIYFGKNSVLCSRHCRILVHHNRQRKAVPHWYNLSWKMKGLPFKFTIFIPMFWFPLPSPHSQNSLNFASTSACVVSVKNILSRTSK